MTSLDFFPPTDHTPRLYPEWGTGKEKGYKENLWTPGPATWQYSGQPIEQFYDLTSLKQSNVRLNDQLLPTPQTSNMHELMINLPFPGEHPYASHIEQKAVFPKFDSASDPKRGVAARSVMPKNDEMPANAYNVTIVSKTKGSGLRHEIQALPPESQKRPLEWHEKQFDQIVKTPSGGQQQFYPWPPKQYVPNLKERSDEGCIAGDMKVSERTATALRNVERDQWTTTYDRAHTGLGPANAYELDNYEDKKTQLYTAGVIDDTLKPISMPEFQPPRPFEGRINRAFTPAPPPQTDILPDPPKDPNYLPKMTRHEIEEDRLWHGKTYVNMPDSEKLKHHKSPEWLEHEGTIHPDVGLGTLVSGRWEKEGEQVPYKAAGRPEPPQWGEIEERALKFHDEVQQVEAQRRWKDLELQKPNNDLTALQQKMALVNVKSQPRVFFEHEGKFQRERAGLYKTTYDPYTFQHSMNKDEKTGGKLFDTSDSHQNALNLDVDLNNDIHETMRYNRTLGGPPGTVPKLHDQPSLYEAIEPFNKAKSLQKAKLQPNAQTADIKTQEGCVVLQESTMGSEFNTQKFLQEHVLPFHTRNEPLGLMSHDNPDLGQVRVTCTPAVPPRDRNLNNSMPLPNISTGEPVLSGSQTDRPRTAPEHSQFANRYSYQSTTPEIYTARTKPPADLPELPVRLGKSKSASRLSSTDQFGSKASNIAPGGDVASSEQFKTAYQSQFPGAKSLDLSYKDDPRFQWDPKSGTPRPQTSLLEIQNTFSKSKTRAEFLSAFPEKNIDLRENHIRGKKHEFDGFNAQILRGTPVEAQV